MAKSGTPDKRMHLRRSYVRRLKKSRLRAEFHRRIAEDAAAELQGKWVVDVGCGPGLLGARLRPLAPGARIIGVDMEPSMAAEAREGAGLEVVLANAASLPFKSGCIDLVLSSASLKDWGEPERGLAEIARALRAEGRAKVYDFITWGEGSKPPRFVRRFGLVSEIARRMMARVLKFTTADAERIGAAAAGSCDVKVERWLDLGVVRIVLNKR